MQDILTSPAMSLVLLLIVAPTRAYAEPSPLAFAWYDRVKEWNEISRLYNKGIGIVEAAKRPNAAHAELSDERRIVFRQAAEKLQQWIKRYVPDQSSEEYARNIYRLGNYWEFAYEFGKAEQAYLTCERHPRVRTTLLNQKPLSIQLPSRLAEVQRNREVKYVGKGKIKRRVVERGSVVKVRKGPDLFTMIVNKILGIGDFKTRTVQDDTVPPEEITDPAS